MNIPANLSRDLLLNAIDNYSLYTSSEKKFLKSLVKLANDGIAVISPLELVSIVGCGKSSVYKNLNKFAQEGMIELQLRGKLVRSIKLNFNSMDSLIKHYEKKISL